MKYLLVVTLLSLFSFKSVSQSQFSVNRLTEIVNGIGDSFETKKYEKEDKIFNCKLKFLEFKYGDSLHIRLGEKIASETDSSYFYGTTNVVSIVLPDGSRVKTFGIQKDASSKIVREIMVTNSKNVPQFGFVFNELGICVIYNEYKVKPDKVLETSYLVNDNILISDLDLLNLNRYLVKNKSASRFKTFYTKSSGLVTLYIR